MLKKYHLVFMTLFYLIDVGLAPIALFLVDWHYHSVWFPYTPQPVPYRHEYIYVAVVLFWAVSFRVFPMYNSKRATLLLNELMLVTIATGAAWLAFTSWMFAFGYTDFSRTALIWFGAISLTLQLAFHLTLRLVLRMLRLRGYNLKRVVIIGAGEVGWQVAEVLMERPWTGFAVVGYLDDDPALQDRVIGSVPVIGTLDNLHEVVETFDVDDEVIFALPPLAHARMVEKIHSIEDIPVNVRVIPDLYGVAYIRPNLEDFWGIPMIGIRKSEISLVNVLMKRIIDLVGAFFGLVLFSPVMLITAILIKLDSPGPVLFRQQRAGENGRTFTIFKFRTMVENSEELLTGLVNIADLEEPVFKLKNDPRVTRIGHFLRRTSVDELPQLFNVLKGEMSLVGPRPEEISLVRRYNSWQRKRLMMKPGMTGPVQINGRGDLPLSVRVQLEEDYIGNYSIWKDLSIILKTIPSVIRGNGSY